MARAHPPAGPSNIPTAAVLSIGDELAIGQTLDTNAGWIADRLTRLGFVVAEHATVDDDLHRLVSTFRRLAGSADAVIATGGLGPTADDLTRQALAAAMDEELVEDARALDTLRAWFAERGPMPEANLVQAMRPRSALLLDNPNGTAPGLAAEIARENAGSTPVFCLPGPPHEMQPMFERFAAPALIPLARTEIRTRLLLTFGLGESSVAERLGGLMDRAREHNGLPTVGTTASRGVVAVRLRHRGPAGEQVENQLDATERDINDRLGGIVFDRRVPSAGDSIDITHGLAEHVVRRLIQSRTRLVVAESCTGGGLGAELTSVPGSSAAFVGGWLTYTNGAKRGMLGVAPKTIAEHGAVSRRCAEEMASGALARAREMGLDADHALAITGIAGPDGGSGAKPVGTVWIARADSDSVEARKFLFRGGRQAIRAWSTQSAMGMLRLALDEIDMPLLGQIE